MADEDIAALLAKQTLVLERIAEGIDQLNATRAAEVAAESLPPPSAPVQAVSPATTLRTKG